VLISYRRGICPSGCVTLLYFVKTTQARITKFSLYAATKILSL